MSTEKRGIIERIRAGYGDKIADAVCAEANDPESPAFNQPFVVLKRLRDSDPDIQAMLESMRQSKEIPYNT